MLITAQTLLGQFILSEKPLKPLLHLIVLQNIPPMANNKPLKEKI
jgi:hypothetical protein